MDDLTAPFPITRSPFFDKLSALEIILDDKVFLPVALQLFQPNGKDRTVFQFQNRQENDLWEKFKRDFTRPRTPTGWKRIVENHATPQPGAGQMPPVTIQRRQARQETTPSAPR